MVTQETRYSDLGPDQSAARYALILSLKDAIKADALSIRAEKRELRAVARINGVSAANWQSRLHQHCLEARARLLIYGTLRGKTWDQIENRHAEVNPRLRYWIANVWAKANTFGVPMPAQLETFK